MIKNNVSLFVLMIGFLFLEGCYSFKGISIDPEVKTFYVHPFKNETFSAPATMDQITTEALREKIRSESRLINNDSEPDIEFKGSITGYAVTAEAPEAGETTSLNRLTISLKVEYINHQFEDKEWSSGFSYFFNFPSSTNLSDIEDEAIDAILTQLMEDIFNKAFTDW